MTASPHRSVTIALLIVAVSGITVTACSGGSPAAGGAAGQAQPAGAARHTAGPVRVVAGYLPPPAPLASFTGGPARPWLPAGRLVRGRHAVYTTTLLPPGGSTPAGVAWLDTRLLRARLYSGSLSPGGFGYRYTAPVEPAQAMTLVAAFNGGFLLKDTRGGYYTKHRMVAPLRDGAASLAIYKDGSVAVGAWGSEVTMTADVVSVRQNLTPLIDHGT